jgi:lipoate-protein ligase A
MKFQLWQQEIEFVDSSALSGKENMELDLHNLDNLIAQKGNAIFRLYKWQPYCISLGYNQKQDFINQEQLSKDNIDLVYRPTGGRAVFHSEEITYSIVVPLNDKLTKHDVYRDIHLLLLNSFLKLGAKLDYVENNSDLNNFYKSNKLAFACFASSAKNELIYNGRKIVGSAQRIKDGYLLQHGSILLGDKHLDIVHYLNKLDISNKEEYINSLKCQTVSLSEILGRSIDYNEVSDAIKSICGVQ